MKPPPTGRQKVADVCPHVGAWLRSLPRDFETMSNQNARGNRNCPTNETGVPSRDPSRADSRDSASSAKSKDQIPHEGHPSESDGSGQDNTCGPHDHVLIGKQSSKTKVYHLPAADDPSNPACHHGTENGRGKVGSWLPIDLDSSRLDDKRLCQWCDPDVEVDSGMPETTGAATLSDLDPDDVNIRSDGGRRAYPARRHSALADAGVGDQAPGGGCRHSDDALPCSQCFLDGGDA